MTFQRSMLESFVKIVNGFQLITFFDVGKGSIYNSGEMTLMKKVMNLSPRS